MAGEEDLASGTRSSHEHLSAVDMADLMLAVAASRDVASVSLEPSNRGHDLAIDGRFGGRDPVRLDPELGDAVAARLALLARLDLAAAQPAIGVLSVRAAQASLDLMVSLSQHPAGLGVEVRRLAPRTPAASAEQLLLEPGARIGPYQIVEPLGAGGMGMVFHVVHETLDRSLAMKVLHRKLLQNPINLTRFFREARAAGRAESPDIVNVTDCGTLPDGRPFLVMELVRWPTLSTVLEWGPLDPLRAANIGAQIAMALHTAHGRGVLHHDVKPENIFLGPHDVIKLGDFGAAKLSDPSEPVTDLAPAAGGKAQNFYGTAAYAAPEQARGLPTDQRTDIYAVGCVLFELVTGQVPFDAPRSFDLLVKHITAPIPDLIGPSGPVPQALAAVIKRALAKQPEERQQNALQLASELRHAQGVLARKGWEGVAAMTTQAVTTIVAVDDDPIVLRSLERGLNRPGFRIVILEKPADVLFLLQTESVDILISDMDMPNMTGLELLSLVRRSFPTVVRILLTGDTKIDTALRAINEGEVFRYLTKPWSLDNLLSTIDDAVARLPELRRVPRAADAARAQADLLASLEADHPGITATPPDGEPYPIDKERTSALVAQLPRSLLRSFLEQQLRPPPSPPPAPPA